MMLSYVDWYYNECSWRSSALILKKSSNPCIRADTEHLLKTQAFQTLFSAVKNAEIDENSVISKTIFFLTFRILCRILISLMNRPGPCTIQCISEVTSILSTPSSLISVEFSPLNPLYKTLFYSIIKSSNWNSVSTRTINIAGIMYEILKNI